MPTLAPVKIIIAGVDKFSREFNKSFKAAQSVGKKMSSVGKQMTAGITLPAVGAGVAILKTAAQFESSMNKVEALTQAPQEQLLQMSELAKDLGSTTKFSATQAADAMGFLGMAGWETNEILSATPDILNLAAASNLELARAADITSNVMGAFELSAKDAGKAADILAGITSSANVDMEMMAETMKDAAPIAKQFGSNLKDASVIAGFLGNIGIQGSKAGTAMKNVYTTLASPPSKALKWFNKLNVETKDAKGNLLPVADVFKKLGSELGAMTEAERLTAIKDIFGKIPIASAAALASDLGKSNSEFIKLAEKMSTVDGRAESMAKTMGKGLTGAWVSMMSALEGLSLAIADSGLLEFITKIVQRFTGFIRSLTKTNPELLKLGTIIVAILAAAGPLILLFGTIILKLSALSAAVVQAGGVIALLSNPIGWIVAGIMALIVVITALWKHAEPLRKVIGELLARAFIILQPLIISVKNLFIELWNATVAIFKALQPLFALFIDFSGGGALSGLELAVGILRVMLDVVTKIVHWITKLINLLSKATTGMANIMSGPMGFANKMLGGATGYATKAADAVSGFLFDDEKSTPNNENLNTAIEAIAGKQKAANGVVKVQFDNPPPGMRAEVTGQNINADMDTGPIMQGAY